MPPRKRAVASSKSAPPANSESQAHADPEVQERYVGQWNRLVSTTNWEKGRIICQWREALMAAAAAITEYSDEAWSQLVGNVTSQHVGRLRRVYQRFGDVADQYEGLYWSHFQAALDWDDAEMWLEGSIQNQWSVSQMRGKRWEAHGTPTDQQQVEVSLDRVSADDVAEATPGKGGEADAPWESEAASAATPNKPSEKAPSVDDEKSAIESKTEPVASQPEKAEKRTRLSVDVDSLPDDLAEAFESFKLAIIAHRREGWRDTTPASVVECLESLKTLALAE